MDPLPAYGALVLMALTPVYAGAYAGLTYPPKTGHRPDDRDERVHKEFFSFSDAKWYPVVGSVTLVSLYAVLKYVSKDVINVLLSANFVIIGYFAAVEVAIDALGWSLGRPLLGSFLLALNKVGSGSANKSRSGDSDPIFKLRFGYTHAVIWVVVAALTALYAFSKHWILSNLLAAAFSITAIKLLSLDSFSTGIMLLAGLFLYDVFWVFGTEVMVTVAKGLDVPIKVVFPKNVTAALEYGLFNNPKDVGFTMLGLGDIVIPGIFIALCLSYDHHKFLKTASKATKHSRSFPTPYFTVCIVNYVIGLVLTIYVMHTFKAAQPALLYLSPACIFSALSVAWFLGDLKGLFAFEAEGSILAETSAKAGKSEKRERRKSVSVKRGKGEAKAGGRGRKRSASIKPE
ncbi:signal peptide peptidase-domain-containing protein [Chytriomyces sp. MP71]|nr:signal peptide peptidase-domain-containing protein [Chytriomyces sp. MP71]